MRRNQDQVWSRLQSDDRPKQDQLQELRQEVNIFKYNFSYALRSHKIYVGETYVCEVHATDMGGKAHGLHFQTSD